MRKLDWEYEDRFDGQPEPPFTEEERHSLFMRHQYVIERSASNWWERRPMMRGRAVCMECREDWNGGGCSTIRALSLLSVRQRQVVKLLTRQGQVIDLLADHRTMREVLYERGRAVLELRLQVDGHAFSVGKMELIRELLSKVHDDFKERLKERNPPSQMETFAVALNTGLANQARRTK